jgi:hypothetical protein
MEQPSNVKVALDEVVRLQREAKRLREALQEIADADPVDMALDPNWPARIASAALDR